MGWTVSYELRRDIPLTADERTWLEQHVARRAYDLTLAPGPNVLASGFAKVPFEPEDDDWHDLLVAITELRRRFPDAECEVDDTYDGVYWDEELEAYSNGLRDGVSFVEEGDDDGEVEDDEADDPARGRLQLTRDATDGPIAATLEARLEDQDLTVDIRLEKAVPQLEVTGVRLVARAADGAPCFCKVLASPTGERLYVSEDFADVVSSFELFAIVRREVNDLVASYDAKAALATADRLAPIELAPRMAPAGVGIELSSLVSWTVNEYSDQEIRLLTCVQAADALEYSVVLAFKLLDEAGTELANSDPYLRVPIGHVQARTGRLPERTITDLRRIDVFAKGRIEGQISLGQFRITRPARSSSRQ